MTADNGTAGPVALWTTLRASADLVDAVVRRYAYLDRDGWERLSAELKQASIQARVLGELQPTPLEVRNESDRH